MLYRYLIALFTFSLTACSSVDVDENAGKGLELHPRQFFDGKICADGVVRDYAGTQLRNFNAEIIATWDQQGNGRLDETFRFNDGMEYRVWRFEPQYDRNSRKKVIAYRATASDVHDATTLAFSGNAIYMDYDLDYQTGTDEQGKPETLSISMVDRMYLVSPDVLISETRMYKLGLSVGQVMLVMRRVSDDEQCLVSIE